MNGDRDPERERERSMRTRDWDGWIVRNECFGKWQTYEIMRVNG